MYINLSSMGEINFNGRYDLDEVYFNNGTVNRLVWQRALGTHLINLNERYWSLYNNQFTPWWIEVSNAYCNHYIASYLNVFATDEFFDGYNYYQIPSFGDAGDSGVDYIYYWSESHDKKNKVAKITKVGETSWNNLRLFNYAWQKNKRQTLLYMNEDSSRIFENKGYYEVRHGGYDQGDNVYPYRKVFFNSRFGYNSYNGRNFYDLTTSKGTYYDRVIMNYGDDSYTNYRSDDYRGKNHFCFYRTTNISNLFYDFSNFAGNKDGWAINGRNLIDISNAYYGTRIAFPTCPSNVKIAKYAYAWCNNLYNSYCSNYLEFADGMYEGSIFNTVNNFYQFQNYNKGAIFSDKGYLYYKENSERVTNLKFPTFNEKELDKTQPKTYHYYTEDEQYKLVYFYKPDDVYQASGIRFEKLIEVNNVGIALCGDNVKYMNNMYRNSSGLSIPQCGDSVYEMIGAYENADMLDYAVCGTSVRDMSRAYLGTIISDNQAVVGGAVEFMEYSYASGGHIVPIIGPKVASSHGAFSKYHGAWIQGYAYNTLRTTDNFYFTVYSPAGVEYDFDSSCNDSRLSNINMNWQKNSTDNTGIYQNYHYSIFCSDRDTNEIPEFKMHDNIIDISRMYAKRVAPVDQPALCGSSVTKMEFAYYRSYNLRTANVGEKVVFMNGAYAYCNNISEAVSGPNVFFMDGAYYGCDNLTKAVAIPNQQWYITENYRFNDIWRSGSDARPERTIGYGSKSIMDDINFPADIGGAGETRSYNGIGILIPEKMGEGKIYKSMIATYGNCKRLETPACGDYIAMVDRCYKDCWNLKSTEIGNNVIWMHEMYMNCYNIKQAKSGPNVINMVGSYNNCFNLVGVAACGPKVVELRNCYYNCNNLQYSACSDSVVNMQYAYYNCEKLLNASCGSSVVNMEYAYYNCKTITAANVGDNVRDMNWAFAQCDSLLTADCGVNVTTMTSSYENCFRLENAACGDNVRKMINTYKGCPNLINAACGNNVESLIGTYQDLAKLKIARVGENTYDITNAYKNCPVLIECEVGKNTNLMNYAYSDCPSLTYAKSGESVVDMVGSYQNDYSLLTAECGINVVNMNNCYRNCSSLVTAVCNSSVANFQGAYADCTSLTVSVFGPNLYNMDESYLNCYLINNIGGSSRVYSMNNTFRNCNNVNGYNIYTHIYYDTDLDAVTIDLTESYEDSFIAYSTVYAVNTYSGTYDESTKTWIDNTACINIKGIGASAIRGYFGSSYGLMNNTYRGCKNLSLACIHSNVIYDNTFTDCINLKSVGFREEEYREFKGITSIFDTTNTNFYLRQMNNLSGALSIRQAFTNCYNLKGDFIINNKLPASNLYRAFQNCSNINSVNFTGPMYATNIEGLFDGCSNLKQSLSTEILNGVKNMDYTYRNCSSLTKVNFGNCVNSLNYTCSGCSSLEEIAYLGTTANKKNINYAIGLFENCINLKEQIFMLNVGTQRKYISYMYANCKSLSGEQYFKATPDYYSMDGLYLGCENITNMLGSCNGTVNMLFENCYNLEYIPYGNVYGSRTYYNCYSLKELNFNTIYTYNSYAMLYNCQNLTFIPGSMLAAGGSLYSNNFDECYYNCINAEYIKSSWTYDEKSEGEIYPVCRGGYGFFLGEYSYYNCSNLKGEENPLYSKLYFDTRYRNDSLAYGMYNCKNYQSDIIFSFSFGEFTSLNMDYTFYNCNSLKSIFFDDYTSKGEKIDYNTTIKLNNTFLRLKDDEKDEMNRFNLVINNRDFYNSIITRGPEMGVGTLERLDISGETVRFDFKDYTGVSKYQFVVDVDRCMYNAANKFYIYCVTKEEETEE